MEINTSGRLANKGPKRGTDGKLSITFPMGDKKMAGIASGDIGKCAYGIFKKGASLIGKRVGVAGDQLICAEMAEALSKALGEEVSYHEITPEQYLHTRNSHGN